MTGLNYGERACAFEEAVEQGLGAEAEALALFGTASYVDTLQVLAHEREPRALGAGGGITIVHDPQEFLMWQLAVDDFLDRWDGSKEDAFGRAFGDPDFETAPAVALPRAA